MKKAAHIVWVAAIVCSLAQAGGSAEPVTIESLKITGTTYWMGSGFMLIDASKPCVVQSRALWLADDAVLSFHNAI